MRPPRSATQTEAQTVGIDPPSTDRPPLEQRRTPARRAVRRGSTCQPEGSLSDPPHMKRPCLHPCANAGDRIEDFPANPDEGRPCPPRARSLRVERSDRPRKLACCSSERYPRSGRSSNTATLLLRFSRVKLPDPKPVGAIYITSICLSPPSGSFWRPYRSNRFPVCY